MLISSKCFEDIELQKEVENESTHKNQKCDVCGSIEDNLIDIEYFADFFISIVSLFKKNSDSSQTLVDAIQSKWGMFSEKSYGETILSHIISKYSLPIVTTDSVSYSDEVQSKIDIWHRIKTDLMTKNRFFVEYDDFEKLQIFPEQYSLNLHKGEILYRARITEEGKIKMCPKEMGCPPSKKASAGRANPLGIPYLYLCKEIKTTYYEIRVSYLDNISVGRFKILRDLNIADFDFIFSPYLVYANGGVEELQKQVIRYEILSEFRKNLSKPLARYDTELEYVPTQWICEYCKINGYDGVSFASSRDKNGINYVLFNPADAKCTRVTSHIIEGIDISAEENRVS